MPNQPGLKALSMPERYRANKITRDRRELPEKIGVKARRRGNTTAARVLCGAETLRGALLSDDVDRDRGRHLWVDLNHDLELAKLTDHAFG